MTIVEALKTYKPIRRPISKHLGSAGCGWLDREYVLHLLICGQIRTMATSMNEWACRPIMVDEYDILADDWECKDDKYR